jgi:tripartite-type tricarboxylate transporter receptor subunit TctC
MHQRDVKERMAGGGSEVVTGTPEQLAAKLKSDDTKMRALFKRIGLTPDK